jgi:hypothetical protein
MVLEKLSQLPDSIAAPAQKAHWAALKARVPPLPSAGGKHIPVRSHVLFFYHVPIQNV